MALFKVNKKSATKKQIDTGVKSGVNIVERVAQIKALVNKNLGHLKDEYIIIRTEEELRRYIASCIINGIVAIDTETAGLDPISDKIVGICLYTPGQKAAYIPINHRSYVTQLRVANQLTEKQCGKYLQELVDNDVKEIYFNNQFDVRFLKKCGLNMNPYWDTSIASRMLNENEESRALKPLHNKYCLGGKGDAFKFDDLFKGITFDLVPIEVGYIYAAHDAIITYEFYEFQLPYLTPDNPKCIAQGLEQVAKAFMEIEMPVSKVLCEMECTGIYYDLEHNQMLHDKYVKHRDELIDKCYDLISMYDSEIALYRVKNANSKLSDPINLSSSTQLAILFYDIIKVGEVDKKSPRGTGADILAKMKNPIADMICKYKAVDKLLGTFIDKLPNEVQKDGRIHCKFHSYGADTGRMSCSSPNLQQIPSKNHDVRQSFKASDGCVLMSSDYSAQEPRALGALCYLEQGDPQMRDAFIAGKDIYAEIASLSFHKPYEDCLEFRPDGTTNPDGKKRRTQAKSVTLGVLYGRGEASIAEQLGCSIEEAKGIKQAVFNGFPCIKRFEEDSMRMAKELGYVTTIAGRKRRLPILQEPDYVFKWINGTAPDDDPLGFDCFDNDTEVSERLVRKYTAKLNKAWGRQKQEIILEAKSEGVNIIDNTMKKADATRQVVNSRIQGSAADLSKAALIALGNNKYLKSIGFRVLVPVHDEFIIECPKEHALECKQILADTMCKAAEELLKAPIKCDVEVTEKWYGEPITDEEMIAWQK